MLDDLVCSTNSPEHFSVQQVMLHLPMLVRHITSAHLTHWVTPTCVQSGEARLAARPSCSPSCSLLSLSYQHVFTITSPFANVGSYASGTHHSQTMLHAHVSHKTTHGEKVLELESCLPHCYMYWQYMLALSVTVHVHPNESTEVP